MTTPYANSAVKAAQITLAAATATKLGSGASGVPLANRLLVRVLNPDASQTLYLGDSSTTDATGWQVAPGDQTDWIPMGPGIDLYGYFINGGTAAIMELA